MAQDEIFAAMELLGGICINKDLVEMGYKYSDRDLKALYKNRRIDKIPSVFHEGRGGRIMVYYTI